MRLVILDRDGVINEDSDAFIKSVDEWRPIPGSIEAIARLNRAGFTTAIATNQSGIARGLLTPATLDAIHRKLNDAVTAAGGRIAHLAYCPHGPNDDCLCRKPRPGLIDQIVAALEVPPDADLFVVGDSLRDLEAGLARSARPVLVRTGKGQRTLDDPTARLPDGTLVVDDLAAFAALHEGAA
jgi:D-glycero-D-manno-heptose 1,7-bisphosphate phosphatase